MIMKLPPLIPQEIYLLERYSSLAYYGQMRDHFAALVNAAEDALVAFMRKLPPDYRSRPLNEQPDAVWGERIIPNIQWVLRGLNTGYIRMSHGDWEAMGMAGNVEHAFAAINRDYSFDWMDEPFHTAFDAAWRRTSRPAANINISSMAEWEHGDLTDQYTEPNRGPMLAPASWPLYRSNHAVQVKTGDIVQRNGIYLPNTAALSCAQVLIKGYKAFGATAPDHPDGSSNQVPTTWTLVERVADSGGGIPGDPDPIKAGVRLRCAAGQPCPRAGFWFTPARTGSRQHFEPGQVMPDTGSAWGATIWQSDEQT
jgi:hypothetical protein